jgi:hypothetical protein
MVEGEEASQVAALGGEGGLRLAGDLDNQRAGPSLSGSFRGSNGGWNVMGWIIWQYEGGV